MDDKKTKDTLDRQKAYEAFNETVKGNTEEAAGKEIYLNEVVMGYAKPRETKND